MGASVANCLITATVLSYWFFYLHACMLFSSINGKTHSNRKSQFFYFVYLHNLNSVSIRPHTVKNTVTNTVKNMTNLANYLSDQATLVYVQDSMCTWTHISFYLFMQQNLCNGLGVCNVLSSCCECFIYMLQTMYIVTILCIHVYITVLSPISVHDYIKF